MHQSDPSAGRMARRGVPRAVRHRSRAATRFTQPAVRSRTCKLNDVAPQAYFADVLAKLVNLWPASRIDELMPWAWGAAHRIAEPEKVAA